MTADEVKELKKGILLTASYYGRELKGEVITMMADDLSDLGFSDVSNAYLKYRRDPKNKTMPLPAQVREIIAPVISPVSEAREVVGRILEALAKFGHSNLLLARQHIGEIGWRHVNRQGGWTALCESHFIGDSNKQAQMRDAITDQINYGDKLGISTMAPVLPYDQNKTYELSESSENKNILEFDHERSRQMKEFMEKFNLNSEMATIEDLK